MNRNFDGMVPEYSVESKRVNPKVYKWSRPMINRYRKLLSSVYNAQECREPILGGARIIDCEDPRSALGNIKPREIMDIAEAALDLKREVQISTNIGEDQFLFDRAESRSGKMLSLENRM